ncbi:MAG: sulfite exporter TauE/SafE family protein [Caldilineaceae bacterium]
MHVFTLPAYPTAFWVTAAFVMILTGLGKSGFGSGIGALATPLLALIIPVADAAALMLPLLIIMDFFTLPYYYTKRRFDVTHLRILLLSSLIGIAIGGYYFDALSHNEQAMKMGIGALALLFVLLQVGRSLIFGALSDHRPPPLAGWILGAVGGFTSTVAHAGGPPVTIYLVPQNLPRDRYVGTTVLLFAAINLIKLIPYYFLGLLRIGDLGTVLLLAPLAYVGVRLGIWLNQRFNNLWFTRFIYTFLFLTGLQLLTGWNLLAMLFRLGA